MTRYPGRLAGPMVGAAALALLSVGFVAAHTVEHAGPYAVEIGWKIEPTYVGAANAVVVIVRDAAGKPITDLGGDDLHVVVSTGGQQTEALTFEPGFDLEENLGTPGEYDAALLPTAVGDYTFHITGAIKGEAVDLTVTSSAETFDPVRGTTDIEFPAKLPSIPEIVTRLDRIDARVAAISQGTGGPSQASVEAAVNAAADARQAADRALVAGVAVGLIGCVVGSLGLLLAVRATRRTRA